MKTDRWLRLRAAVCTHYFHITYAHLSSAEQMFIIDHWIDIIIDEAKKHTPAATFKKKYALRMRMVLP